MVRFLGIVTLLALCLLLCLGSDDTTAEQALEQEDECHDDAGGLAQCALSALQLRSTAQEKAVPTALPQGRQISNRGVLQVWQRQLQRGLQLLSKANETANPHHSDGVVAVANDMPVLVERGADSEGVETKKATLNATVAEIEHSDFCKAKRNGLYCQGDKIVSCKGQPAPTVVDACEPYTYQDGQCSFTEYRKCSRSWTGPSCITHKQDHECSGGGGGYGGDYGYGHSPGFTNDGYGQDLTKDWGSRPGFTNYADRRRSSYSSIGNRYRSYSSSSGSGYARGGSSYSSSSRSGSSSSSGGGGSRRR